MNKILKFKWRQIFGLLLLVIAATLLYRHRSEIKYSFDLTKQIQPLFLLAILFVQFLTYVSDALVIKSLFRIFRQTKIPFKKFFQAAIIAKFLNNALPSAGASGSSFLINFFHRESIKNGQAAVASLIFYLFYILSFFLFLLFSLIYLFLKGGLGTSYALAGGISITIFSVLLLFLFFLLQSQVKFFSFLGRLILKINSFFYHHFKWTVFSSPRLLKFFEEMTIGEKLITADKRKLIAPFVYSALFNFFHYLTIYLIFLSFSFPVSIEKIICGASIAGLISFVTFLPGGFGVYETSMAMTYYNLGVPLNLAILVTLIFRLFSLWAPIPVGLFLYHRLKWEQK